jgi:hypothetical protein
LKKARELQSLIIFCIDGIVQVYLE